MCVTDHLDMTLAVKDITLAVKPQYNQPKYKLKLSFMEAGREVENRGKDQQYLVDKQNYSYLISKTPVIPFPNKPWYLPVCSTNLLQTQWNKRTMMVLYRSPMY